MKERDDRASRATSSTTIAWTTLGEYLDYLERSAASRRTSPRSSARRRCAIHVIGYDEPRRRRRRSWSRCARWCARRWRRARSASASSLIYAPGVLREDRRADRAVPRSPRAYGGMYISHMRSEGNRLLEAIDELITHRARGGHPGGDLPPEGRRPGQLAEDGRGDRARSRPRAASGLHDHRRHVHLHRRRDGARRRRCRRGCRTAATRSGPSGCRIRRSAQRVRRRCARRPTAGRTSSLAAGSPDKHPARRLQERGAQAADRQDAGRGGAAARRARPRRRPSTW